MGDHCTASLLSEKILKFYQTNNIDEGEEIAKCINSNCTFNWVALRNILLTDGKITDDDPVFPKTYEEYLGYFLRLQPVLQQTEKAFITVDFDDEIFLQKLQWLDQPIRMRTILREHMHPTSETSAMENVLFLTSVLEYGLGNIYQTVTRKAPPHLLRDLLDTKVLRDILGLCPIFFLKIIMGSPDSVNLRNIVWHGFPLPSEVPSHYVSTLLIAGASISALLDATPIKLISRPQITELTRYVSKIRAARLDLTRLNDIARIQKAITHSKWTGMSPHQMFWDQILRHYQNKNYWQFTILILPQIELILRRMYSQAKNFDITAKLGEYYITMDTIFEFKDNETLDGHLCRGITHLLYDLFISPMGMRIRDKISHGEVNLNCIGKDLCSILLYAGLNLITSNRSYSLALYASRFHLNNLAIDCLDAANRSMFNLVSLRTPNNYDLDFAWDPDCAASFHQFEIKCPGEIFNRHRKEPEIVSLIMKISQMVAQVAENYVISFTEKFAKLANHELRLRARATLAQMVRTIPIVASTLQSTIEVLSDLINVINTVNHIWMERTFEGTQRICKQTLTIMENLLRHSHKDKNEWIKAVECCNRFLEVSNNFIVVYARFRRNVI